MDLFIALFCLFIFVCFVSVLAILFLLRRVSVLQWQLEVTLAREIMPFRDGNVQQRSWGLPLVHVTVMYKWMLLATLYLSTREGIC